MEPDQIDMMNEAELRAELRRVVADNISLRAWRESIRTEIGQQPLIVYTDFDWYGWACHRMQHLADQLLEARKLLADADTVIEDWTELLRDGGYRASLIDGDVVRKAIAQSQPQPLGGEPEVTKFQYYFKVTGCHAIGPSDPECICWHDEGSRPCELDKHDDPGTSLRWRSAPRSAQKLGWEQS